MQKGTRSSGIERLTASLRDRPRLAAAITAAATGAVIGLSVLLAGPPLPFKTCLFRFVTGWPCPSCGLTHAFISLGHGHLAQGLVENIMSPALFLAAAMIFIKAAYETLSGRFFLRRLWDRFKTRLLVAFLILAALSWVWNIYRAASHWTY